MQNNFFLAPSADARISKAIFFGRKIFQKSIGEKGRF